MSKTLSAILTLAVLLSVACTTSSPPQTTPGGSAPLTSHPLELNPQERSTDGLDGDCSDVVIGPATVNAGTLAPSSPIHKAFVRGGGRPEMPISPEDAAKLRDLALSLPPSPNVQNLGEAGITPFAPVLGTSFDSIDASECCDVGTSVPPDPELSAGPSHLMAVVNTSVEIYNKTGTSLVGPIDLDAFFGPLTGCTGLFDPTSNYDEEEDRFVLGADDGNAFCLAVTQTGDPTGIWNLYRIPTLVAPATLFDYPHVGIGAEAIFLGSNQFAGGFVEGRIWAFDKDEMYAGVANPGCVSHSTGFDSTPWPADFHGLPFPGGPHYIMTEVFDGALHTVWEWTDPFGADTLVRTGDVDLNAASGVIAGFPIDAPQSGGGLIQANDWRGQSTHYRNGRLWTSTQTISCNPGGGVVDCSRWAEIDPNGGGPSIPTAVQAGVFGSNGDYRTFTSIAADACGNMAIGYSKTSASTFPGAWVTGREAGDPPGTVQAEVVLKAGEVNYSAFDGSPFRWGDYTGMTIDPDGTTFWYLGEYSKNIAGTRWATFIGSFSFGCASDGIFADGFESGTTAAWSSIVP